MAAKDTDDTKTEERDDEISLDMSQTAVKKMIAEARDRGYITYDQLNQVLPPDQVSSDQIEDVMSMLSEMGIQITEDDEEGEDDDAKGSTDIVRAKEKGEITLSTGTAEKLDRTDDPVRMYLREMGSVELLSREGEIAIAKRIEAGRHAMIGGISESPLTLFAIVEWYEALKEGSALLREIIDLDGTYNAANGITHAAPTGPTGEVVPFNPAAAAAAAALKVQQNAAAESEQAAKEAAGEVDPVTTPEGDTVKAKDLSGANGLLFRRNSKTGVIEAIAREGAGWQGLNTDLHDN